MKTAARAVPEHGRIPITGASGNPRQAALPPFTPHRQICPNGSFQAIVVFHNTITTRPAIDSQNIPQETVTQHISAHASLAYGLRIQGASV
jgi:hypothetical protein